MRPHECKVDPQVGEALPVVARHAAKQRALSIHHLVVRDRQDEALEERIKQPERQIVVVVAAMCRPVADVAQRVGEHLV
jgi:hypothetical protein